MEKIKKLMLLVFAMVSIFAITGCCNVDVCYTINKDDTGSMSYSLEASPEISALKAFSKDEVFKKIQDYFDSDLNLTKGIGKDGKEHVYSKDCVESSSAIEDYLLSSNFILTQKDDNIVKIEISPLSEYQDYMDGIDIHKLLVETDGGCKLSIKTEYEVLDQNADTVKDGVYTWDISKRLVAENNENCYIEIKGLDLKDYSSDDKYVKRQENFIKNYVVDTKDKDFRAKALAKLGILKGSDKGLELDKGVTRLEGAIVYARLLGLEDAIEEYKNDGYVNVFTDVPNWAAPTINYLYEIGYVYGVGNDKYGSNQMMTETQFATLLLRALDYSDYDDYDYEDEDYDEEDYEDFYDGERYFKLNEACKKMDELGIYDGDIEGIESIRTGVFNRRLMAYMTYNALFYRSYWSEYYMIDNIIDYHEYVK